MRETHNGRIDSIHIDNYTIYFGRSITKINKSHSKIGGISSIIHNSIIPNITQINRLNGIIMEIRLKTGKNIPDISSLNTYDPHMGYNFDEINSYCADVDNYITTIPHNLVKIWCTGNNG